MLSCGKVNIAMASRVELLKDMEFKKLLSEDVVLIACPEHPWAREKEISPKDLDRTDIILPQEDTEIYSDIRNGLRGVGISIYELKPIMTLGSLEAIALSVQEGLGVAFIPRLLYNRLVIDKVVEIRVRGLEIFRDIYIVRNTCRPATAAQNAFWEFITAIKSETFDHMGSGRSDCKKIPIFG